MERSVDLPTFGKPTNPTSARSFNSKITSLSSPIFPACAKAGACLVEVLNLALPRPPFPPLQTVTDILSSFKS